MSIELTLRYTDNEYVCSYKEKMKTIRHKGLHTYVPLGAFVFLTFVLYQFDKMDTWWGTLLLFTTGIYALLCLLGEWFIPKIALVFARNKKLNDTYHFSIDSQSVKRTSKHGLLEARWSEFDSVDFFQNNIFFNLNRGSMVIPRSRLSNIQFKKLKIYAQSHK